MNIKKWEAFGPKASLLPPVLNLNFKGEKNYLGGIGFNAHMEPSG